MLVRSRIDLASLIGEHWTISGSLSWVAQHLHRFNRLSSSLKQSQMDVSLQAFPVPDAVKSEVLRALWMPSPSHPEPKTQIKKPNLDTYFDTHYSHDCQRFARDGGTLISIKTHGEVVELAKRILQGTTKSAALASLTGNAKADENTLNLCARLITMCDFGNAEFGSSTRRDLSWDNHQTLRQATAVNFQAEKKLQPDNPRIPRFFKARQIARIGGIRIQWTNNLMDHLSLSEGDRAVFVFHHADFLRFQSG